MLLMGQHDVGCDDGGVGIGSDDVHICISMGGMKWGGDVAKLMLWQALDVCNSGGGRRRQCAGAGEGEGPLGLHIIDLWVLAIMG